MTTAVQYVLSDIDKYDLKFVFFMCCGKKFCKPCSDKLVNITKCPMCRHDLPKSEHDNVLLVQKNAALGKAWAQGRLACYYDSQRRQDSDPSIQTNDAEAFRYYLLSSKKGFRLAQESLAMLYYKGRGVERSVKQAIYWYTIAANQGSDQALKHLAAMILRFEIPGKTRSDAGVLFHRGALLGDFESQRSLAYMYYPSNPEKALFWYKKAALQNCSQSQLMISRILS